MQLGEFVKHIDDELTRRGHSTSFCSALTERMSRTGDVSLSNDDGIRFFEPSRQKAAACFLVPLQSGVWHPN